MAALCDIIRVRSGKPARIDRADISVRGRTWSVFDRDHLFRIGRTLCWILAAALAIASLSAAPGAMDGRQGENDELHFTILYTNDLHSALIPHSPAADYHPGPDGSTVGGFARLATAIEEIRENKMARDEPVLLLDAGDFLGGSAFAWLALRDHSPELALMQRMGYDAVVIANHEYDYGPDVLAQYLLRAGYPEAHGSTLLLASNTEAPEDHPLAARDVYRNTGLFELANGLRVGVFGLMGETAVLVIADAGGVRFTDPYEAARRAVEELRRQKADIIVGITHSDLDEDRQLAREVTGIDVIVGGHCHAALHRPVRQGSTIIVKAGQLGEYLGQLELAYNPNTGRLRVRNEENNWPFLVPIDGSSACHPDIEALVREYTLILAEHVSEVTGSTFDDIMSTVARSDFVLSNQPPLSETPLGNFVTDAMRLIAREVTGKRVHIATQASGAIRKSIFPGTMEHSAGNITLYEIVEATGVGYGLDGHAGCPIVSLYITGEEVRRLLEITVLLQEYAGDSFFLHFSGLRYSYNPANAVFMTVPIIDLPIFTTRAVTRAELYTGDGLQDAADGGYVPLKRGDDRLYHVVTDAYLLYFLPMVTDLLPSLEIVPKNATGEPVTLDRIDELIVHHADGRELKVWEAVVRYAATQPMGPDGLPRIPDYYADTAGRIVRIRTLPFIGWFMLLLVAVAAGAVLLLLRRRRQRIAQRTGRTEAMGSPGGPPGEVT
ncbi:MAG: bifunctional metallophosphatase/5'-nucleotidase [Dehalococcoidia bacterium]